MTNIETLIKTVLNKSESSIWRDAVKEWEILDCREDSYADSFCICGKENIKYLFTIRNILNGNILFPIGSSCIKKFQRKDLDEVTNLTVDRFKLLHAIENNKYISLTSEFFSRKLLKTLYEEEAFNTEHNNYKGYNDYNFMLKMFNKRNKDAITSKQHSKINAVIVSSIKPYLQKQLKDKITKKKD